MTDEALKAVGFKFKSPIAPSEEEVEDEEVDEDMEVDLEKVGHHKPTLTNQLKFCLFKMIFHNFPMSKVEETMAGHYSDEEEGDILHIDEYSPSVPGVALEEEGAKIGRIMESK